MKMNNISSLNEMTKTTKEWKKQGFSIGFVPTMGYLHNGHKSLIEKARQENDKVIVSIFVNPIQFGQNEDFSKYPINIERDFKLCKDVGVDIIFTPLARDMYPTENLVYIDVDKLGDWLCGAVRPGHFRGVCTVVAKLFNIVNPNKAYFGEKDAQQLAIIKRMVLDLNFDIKIVSCPIVRESDGLAMSSRNKYLSKDERKAALVISKSLKLAKQSLDYGERKVDTILKLISDEINSEPLAKIDYISLVDPNTIKPIDEILKPVLIAIAVYIGDTRLIDNFLFDKETDYDS
jgi:pantoate--beta-alanine ligase